MMAVDTKQVTVMPFGVLAASDLPDPRGCTGVCCYARSNSDIQGKSVC